MAQRGKRISAKVCCLQSGRARACDTEGYLEVLIESIDEPVREALRWC
jgi:hypothetical protein